MKVNVVYGGPLSGKSTYVDEHRGNNDIVFDYDLLMSALSGLPTHTHNDSLRDYIIDIRTLILQRLNNETALDTAWIITTHLYPELKEALDSLCPEYTHLSVTHEEAKKRLVAGNQGRDIDKWLEILEDYYYSSSDIDSYRFYRSSAWLNKRHEILDRDNNECQMCKDEGAVGIGSLTVHHIKHLKHRVDLALTDSNLITLCSKHHNVVHPEKFGERDRSVPITIEKW